MITMKDIARETGTSQATVSRVLNGNLAVNQEVRNRVMECVKKHNYHPNVLAQSLAANKSLLIGVIIPDISNPFFADLVQVIESEAMKYGYSIILCNTSGNLEKEKHYINILRSYKADGIIMVPRNVKDSFYINLKKIEIPIVVPTICTDGFDCVSVSHIDAGKKVAKHLISRGFKRFAFVGNVGDDKELGFKSELLESGFGGDKDYFFIDYRGKTSILDKILSLINIDADSPLGIFALNDVVALTVLDLLKENNIKIPEMAGLVGFDNTFISREVSPTITSVEQPINDIGKQSVELLIDRITNTENSELKCVLLETQIVSRATTML